MAVNDQSIQGSAGCLQGFVGQATALEDFGDIFAKDYVHNLDRFQLS
jgi:hypothetical protein